MQQVIPETVIFLDLMQLNYAILDLDDTCFGGKGGTLGRKKAHPKTADKLKAPKTTGSSHIL